MTQYRHILVRGVNWLGDSIMATPALLRIREAHPAAQITLLTPAKLADLWQCHPAIDAVITFTPEERTGEVARRLRSGKFDCALVLPNSLRSALECWLARIPRRIGAAGRGRTLLFTEAVRRPSGVAFMQKRTVAEVQRLAQDQPLTKRAPFTHAGHHIYHYLRLAAALGANPEPLAPVIEVREEEVSALRERFSLPRDRPDRPLFGLNPGAEYGAAKRWPEDRFIVAAREIQERTRCRWVLIGGKADVELNEKIEAAIRDDGGDAAGSAGDRQAVWNLTGATSLRELCAAMKACRLLLTNDTGPMHVASAVGTPLVALFGSTTPMLTGPGLPGDPRHRLISAPVSCSPCFLRECPIDFRCMRSISVEQVVESVLNACGPIQ